MAISADRVIKVVDAMETTKANWTSQWDDCVRYALPYKNQSSELSTNGTVRPAPVNGVAVRACSSLAGNLYANGCAIGQEWFAWDVNVPQKKMTKAVKDWAIEATKEGLRYLGNSNFYSIVQVATLDMCAMGTGLIYPEMDKGVLDFRSFDIQNNIFLKVNDKNRHDTLARKFKLTAKEAIQMFGIDKCSEKIKNAITAAQYDDEFEYIQFIYPRKVYGEYIDSTRKDKTNKVFGSVFVEVEARLIAKEEGFDKFPFAIGRFYTATGEEYGRCATMLAMDDIKILQKASAAMMDSSEYVSNPAYAVDDRFEGFSTECGAINYVSNLSAGMVQVIEQGENMQVTDTSIQRLEDAIKEAYFYDLFMGLQQHSYMTAREVDARELLKAQCIAPVVTNYQGELLGGTLMLVYRLLRKNGVIPPPPNGITDEDVNIVYTSRLNTFLKLVNVANNMTAINQIAGLSQTITACPDLAVDLDVRVAIEDIIHGNNANPKLLRNAEDAMKIRQQQAQAKQQAQAMEMAKSAIGNMPMNEPIQQGSAADSMSKLMATGGMV